MTRRAMIVQREGQTTLYSPNVEIRHEGGGKFSLEAITPWVELEKCGVRIDPDEGEGTG